MKSRPAKRCERLKIRPVPEPNHCQLITPDFPTWQPFRTAISEALGLG